MSYGAPMRRIALLISLSFFLSGCIQLEMLLKVKKDGSGSFAETVLFDVGLLEDFLKRLPQQAEVPKPWQIDEAELRANAAKKGKGVEYVSAVPAARGKFKGYTATYTFADVRQISIDPDPGKHAPKGPQQPEEQRSDPMRFEFKKGRTSELVVKIPREDEKSMKKDKPKKIDPNDESFEMMRGFLKDMKVDIALEVEGKVDSTNAKFREGNRITIMSLDFNALLDDTNKLAQVINAGSYDDAAKAFNAVPGMKMETQKAVRVAFK
jgi:hypothetical protein